MQEEERQEKNQKVCERHQIWNLKDKRDRMQEEERQEKDKKVCERHQIWNLKSETQKRQNARRREAREEWEGLWTPSNLKLNQKGQK